METEEENELSLDKPEQLSIPGLKLTKIISPFPRPEDAEVYEKLYPGFFADYVHDINERGKRKFLLELTGMLIAGFLGLISIGAVFFALFLNHANAACAIFVAISGLVGSFIFSSRGNSKKTKT
jgi:hypothetical protein